jgi:hypothetical protein
MQDCSTIRCDPFEMGFLTKWNLCKVSICAGDGLDDFEESD